MTRIALEGITLLADDVQGLAAFFERALGFAVLVREESYVQLQNEGVRLAVFHRAGLGAHTRDHPSFRAPRGGQAVELNFECASAAELPERFAAIVEAGAVAIAEPVRQDWGHLTGFFADPEGNIHPLFAVLPIEG